MKEIEKKETPEVSGGTAPVDGPFIPREWPEPFDYPRSPSGPDPSGPGPETAFQ
jgi:hypothetical protein